MTSTQPASLDQIRQAAHQRYGHMHLDLADGTTVVLRAPLRMPSEELTQLRGMQRQMQAMQDDPEATTDDLMTVMREAVLLVAEDAGPGQALLDEIGEDLSVLQEVFRAYSERTQPGEAQNSAG